MNNQPGPRFVVQLPKEEIDELALRMLEGKVKGGLVKMEEKGGKIILKLT